MFIDTQEELEFEKARTYSYGEENVVVNDPQYLGVLTNGGHLLKDTTDTIHYIKPGWTDLKVKFHRIGC